MSIEYDEAAFVADLLLGESVSDSINSPLIEQKNEALMNDLRHMRDITARMRMQVDVIVQSARALRTRHDQLSNHLKLRYSTYENMMCRLELKRHWILYRRAMRHYHHLHGSLLRSVEGTAPFPAARRRTPERRRAGRASESMAA